MVANGTTQRGGITFHSRYASADLTAMFDDDGELTGIAHGDLDLGPILAKPADAAIEIEARDALFAHVKSEKAAAVEARAAQRRDDEHAFFVPLPGQRVAA